MANGALQALIFDVDGALADAESVHLAAFNHAFSGLGWVWTQDMCLKLLDVSGGKERIQHDWDQVNPDILALNDQDLPGWRCCASGRIPAKAKRPSPSSPYRPLF